MSFFLTSSAESWETFWRQAAGNKALYQSSYERFSKDMVQCQSPRQSAKAPASQRWSGNTLALPSWAQTH